MVTARYLISEFCYETILYPTCVSLVSIAHVFSSGHPLPPLLLLLLPISLLLRQVGGVQRQQQQGHQDWLCLPHRLTFKFLSLSLCTTGVPHQLCSKILHYRIYSMRLSNLVIIQIWLCLTLSSFWSDKLLDIGSGKFSFLFVTRKETVGQSRNLIFLRQHYGYVALHVRVGCGHNDIQ